MADWVTPKTDWEPDDGIGSADLNRIESNTAHLFDKAAHGKKLFTVSGTFVVPPAVTKVYVTIAGGGAGGESGDEDYYGVAGGSGRVVWCRTVATIPGENIAVVVGSGGVGGTFNTNSGFGGDGRASSFGSYISVAGGIARKKNTAARNGGIREIELYYGRGGAGGYGYRSDGDGGAAGVVLVEW